MVKHLVRNTKTIFPIYAAQTTQNHPKCLIPLGPARPKVAKKNNQIPIPKINCFARYQLRERKTEELNGWLTRRLLLSRRSERWENKREDCTGCLKKVVNRILRALLHPGL